MPRGRHGGGGGAARQAEARRDGAGRGPAARLQAAAHGVRRRPAGGEEPLQAGGDRVLQGTAAGGGVGRGRASGGRGRFDAAGALRRAPAGALASSPLSPGLRWALRAPLCGSPVAAKALLVAGRAASRCQMPSCAAQEGHGGLRVPALWPAGCAAAA